MAAPLLLRGIPFISLRLNHHRLAASFLSPLRQSWSSAVDSTRMDEEASSVEKTTAVSSAREPPKYPTWDDPDYRKWKYKEEEILKDIEPITALTKEILHSNRYLDGERLTAEDEKVVVEKLLTYHPNSEDKIGSGLDSIMVMQGNYGEPVGGVWSNAVLADELVVDRHPQFRHSRCLFVVRTDGGWIDFSYQKCLRAYIRDKYPTHAERFIREHFKRGR